MIYPHPHTREGLEKHGYTFVGITEATMPGYGRIRRALIDLNLAHGSIAVFFVGDKWEFYKTPHARPGFKDEPLLP